MKGGSALSKEVLRRCFFAYSFPYFAWIMPIYLFLPKTQKKLLLRKFRNGIRLVHRCPYARASVLFKITKERSLEVYVKNYIQKRLKRMDRSDLIRSTFFNDIFYWDFFKKSTNDHLGHLLKLKRVKLLKPRHESLLLQWIKFSFM